MCYLTHNWEIFGSPYLSTFRTLIHVTFAYFVIRFSCSVLTSFLFYPKKNFLNQHCSLLSCKIGTKIPLTPKNGWYLVHIYCKFAVIASKRMTRFWIVRSSYCSFFTFRTDHFFSIPQIFYHIPYFFWRHTLLLHR